VSAQPTMRLVDCDDWFADARRVPSPNCDARPAGVDIDLAIVHGISLPPGQFGNGKIAALFLNQLDWNENAYYHNIKGLKVSSHLLVERLGALTQFVPLSQRAWHAGQSQFDGRERCNDFSIGIELEGTDQTPYTAAQYHVLARVLSTLMVRFPSISMGRIAGHCHVAPGRKTDPGSSFRWDCIGALLGAPSDWEPAHKTGL
jgi:AmpD protein